MTRRGNRPGQESSMAQNRWTQAEEAQLQRDYADTATPILARRFHCSVEAVRSKAKRMGLKKSAEYLDTALSGRFRSGRRPSSHRPVGAQRTTHDGYLQRKVSDTGYAPRDWTGEHILMWEAQHGPVAQGHVVSFRDGNRHNLRVENLELISRADLIRRNTIHRYPPALKKAMRQAGQLRKAIRERNHEKQD